MVSIEIEGESVASSFTPPECLGKQVTSLEAVKNVNLAHSGLPKEYQYLLR